MELPVSVALQQVKNIFFCVTLEYLETFVGTSHNSLNILLSYILYI